MPLRILAVAVVALLFAFAQTMSLGGLFGPNASDANAYAAALNPQRPSSAVMQDEDNDDGDDDDDDDDDNSEDEDADNQDEDEDSDNEDTDADNEDEDADNEDASDEDEDASDDDEDADNGDGGEVAGALPIEDEALKQPLTQVTGASTGGDVLVATPGERVALRMFSWMPAGIQVTIRPVDPATLVTAPGTRVADLAFIVEAKDANGVQLTALPAEVNLAVRYADSTVSGLNEDALTLSRLNPTTNQWQTAPKFVKESASNYLAASVTELGTYQVYAQ